MIFIISTFDPRGNAKFNFHIHQTILINSLIQVLGFGKRKATSHGGHGWLLIARRDDSVCRILLSSDCVKGSGSNGVGKHNSSQIVLERS